jgi:hypothetical protein
MRWRRVAPVIDRGWLRRGLVRLGRGQSRTVSHREINASNFIVVSKRARIALTDHAAVFQYIDMFGDCERAAGILLHQ